MRGAIGSLPLRMLLKAVTIVAHCAFRRIAFRRFASGDMSSASGSYIAHADIAVRSATIGRASLGNDFNRAITGAGNALLAAIFSEVSLSSVAFGRRPNHRRWLVSSNVEFGASSWMLYPR